MGRARCGIAAQQLFQKADRRRAPPATPAPRGAQCSADQLSHHKIRAKQIMAEVQSTPVKPHLVVQRLLLHAQPLGVRRAVRQLHHVELRRFRHMSSSYTRAHADQASALRSQLQAGCGHPPRHGLPPLPCCKRSRMHHSVHSMHSAPAAGRPASEPCPAHAPPPAHSTAPLQQVLRVENAVLL